MQVILGLVDVAGHGKCLPEHGQNGCNPGAAVRRGLKKSDRFVSTPGVEMFIGEVE